MVNLDFQRIFFFFYREKKVDHCYLVVAILQKVLEHSYGGCSKRIQAKIESMMAAEYYESHDYEQAKVMSLTSFLFFFLFFSPFSFP